MSAACQLFYNQTPMDFRTATDRLGKKITADDIAEAFGVARNTIARARLDPSNPEYRSPPQNWKPVLARLARDRSRELTAFADELDG
jgi:transcriptional regulator with XRE-family HTH domain